PARPIWWKYLPKSPSRIAAVSLPLCVPRIRAREPRNRAAACNVLLIALAIYGSPGALRQAHAGEPRHAIAMHGAPALPEGFTRLPYAAPAAPRAGLVLHGVLGPFDSLNPLIVRGIAPPSIRGYVIESLMARGYDEPFTLYGLIARAIETDAQRSYVTFYLDPAAKFSDGK